MMQQRLVESLVGLFFTSAIICLCVLALKVSGLTSLFPHEGYDIYATFDDIGGLKVRAPVKIGGVQIGQVEAINLDPATFKAVVKMKIQKQFNQIPDDSSAGILTAGLLGDNYIAITPMYNERFLKNNAKIEITQSAMVLEKLIGQLIYKISNNNDSATAKADATTTADVTNPQNGEQHANQ